MREDPDAVVPSEEGRDLSLEPVLDSRGAGDAPHASAGRKNSERNGLLEALVLVVVAFLLAFTLKSYVAEAYEIKGRSMAPTFANGQRVVVLKAFYGLERGDIVVFSSVEDPGKDLIKRIVGLPGEVIEVRGGHVYVNDAELDEDYVEYADRSRATRHRVPKGTYYVLGDNRPDSHDSRYFREIPAENIKGKVLIRWWPFNEFRSF